MQLPRPLSEQALHQMMRDTRYWNNFHPEHAALVDLVRQGFEELFPGPLAFDATGRMINDPAPEQAGGPDPTVHVRSYTQTRGDGSVQVSEHDRSAPGGGAAAQSGEGKGPKPPANTKSPVPNPKVRVDKAGDGNFGARRTRPDGSRYQHEGIDLEAAPGTPVVSPVDGKVQSIKGTYKDGRYGDQYKTIWIKGSDGNQYAVGYVSPSDGDGRPLTKEGASVKAGEPIGTVQDRARSDASGQMKNHVHVEVRVDGRPIDPNPYVRRWQSP